MTRLLHSPFDRLSVCSNEFSSLNLVRSFEQSLVENFRSRFPYFHLQRDDLVFEDTDTRRTSSDDSAAITVARDFYGIHKSAIYEIFATLFQPTLRLSSYFRRPRGFGR